MRFLEEAAGQATASIACVPATVDSMPKVILTLRPVGYFIVTAVYLGVLVALALFGWGGLFLGLNGGFGAGSGGYDVFVFLLVVVFVGPTLGAALGIATALVTSVVMLGGLAFVRSSLMPR